MSNEKELAFDALVELVALSPKSIRRGIIEMCCGDRRLWPFVEAIEEMLGDICEDCEEPLIDCIVPEGRREEHMGSVIKICAKCNIKKYEERHGNGK